MKIPQSELDEVIFSMFSHPEYLDASYVISEYRKCGVAVIPDPFSTDVVFSIRQALLAGTPLSVIRIGDGEANLLSYGAYSETPCLNYYVVEKIVSMQRDRFNVNSTWMIILRDLMMSSLLQADIIGVIGLWRTGPANIDNFTKRFLKEHRSISGHWRGIDYMLSLARRNVFSGKILASAHLYFSVLDNLKYIFLEEKTVFVLSDREKAVDKLSRNYPDVNFKHIKVGCFAGDLLRDAPDFLSLVYSALPEKMVGSLSLIGAGPWAEIYCTWIKQKGGVAVDIGSGLDLLDGSLTRPIHKTLGLQKIHGYSL